MPVRCVRLPTQLVSEPFCLNGDLAHHLVQREVLRCGWWWWWHGGHAPLCTASFMHRRCTAAAFRAATSTRSRTRTRPRTLTRTRTRTCTLTRTRTTPVVRSVQIKRNVNRWLRPQVRVRPARHIAWQDQEFFAVHFPHSRKLVLHVNIPRHPSLFDGRKIAPWIRESQFAAGGSLQHVAAAQGRYQWTSHAAREEGKIA